MDNMPLFSEEVRRDLVRELRRFVGEPVRVEFHPPGKKGGASVHEGSLAGVYRHGFLIDGEEVGRRAFFSCADLFAGHARIVGGPAASPVRTTLTRLRVELSRLAPSRVTNSDLHAALA